ncbi:MAG TPA: M13 family metallopeptidase [Puia sp.]|nr:M13 family metallopeptidase [Puia sp.]
MKMFLSVFFVASLIFFSCQTPADQKNNGAQPDPLDISSQDSSVRPQSDFYLFANGSWLKKTEIPPAQSVWGSSSTLFDSSTNRLHGILDSLADITNAPMGSIAQQTGDLFVSGMDSAGIEKKGFLPVKAELDSIALIKNKEEIKYEIAKENMINHRPFFSFYVGADDRNSLINAAHFDQGGLGLPSRDYYFKKDSSSKNIRAAYLAYMTKIFTFLGQPLSLAGQHAKSVFDLEISMANISKSPVELRDPVANYNKIMLSNNPDLKKLVVAFGVTADTIISGQPAYYKGLNKLLNNVSLETLKSYLIFHVMDDDAYYLSGDFVNAKFEFNKFLNGATQLRERWKRMTSMVDEELGDNLSRLYVQKYFTAADKERISQMVDNLLVSFGERIRQLDWMSDSTKQKALVKLHAIVKKIGYPDHWKDYSSIHITRDDLLSNIRGTSNYRHKKDIEKIGKPVDRTEWQITASTINAYYDPTQNNINFTAGILQPPFYFSSGDDAVNYGAIGVVIGHEMTHGFDDQGRQYNADGNLKDWWSAEDAKRFKQRAMNIINQYNGYIAVDTFHLNGELTQGENIADNGGLANAYAAFKKTPQGKGNEKINGLTPDQRFFLAFSQISKMKIRKERLITLARTDPHSAPMWRVNGSVSNMPAFYEAFDVKSTDSMYRSDSLRVKIW